MVTRNCAKSLSQIARLAKHRKPTCRKYEFAIFDFISLSKSAIRYYSILCSSTQRFYQNIGPKTFKNRRTTTNNHGQPQKVIKEYIIFLSIKMMVVVRGSSWQFVDFSRFLVILQCFWAHQIVLSTLSEIILTSEL